MNELTCHEIGELLPGYASDALDEQERCAAAGHLAECRNHDAELQALRSSFASLASVVEPVAPPDALRGRLLDAFDREITRPPAVLTERPAPRRMRLISAPNFGYTLAAGLLLIAIGLGVWGASRGGGTEVLARSTSDQAGSLQVVYIPSRSLGVIDYDLSALPAGRTYQAWHVDDAGNPVSLGVLANTRGSLGFEGDFAGGAVALSVEPAGGSRAPTTTPLLVTPLSES